jgi:hypothetical protein
MKYDFDTFECPRDVAGIDEITLDKFHAFAKRREIVAVPGAQVIEYSHTIAALNKRRRNV